MYIVHKSIYKYLIVHTLTLLLRKVPMYVGLHIYNSDNDDYIS